MNARDNAAKVIDQLARKARPTPKPRRSRGGARSRAIICPMCVELNRDVTVHVVHFNAKGCPEHAEQLQSRRKYARHGKKIRAAVRAAYRANPIPKRKREKIRHLTDPRVRARLAVYRQEHRAENVEYQRAYRARQKKMWGKIAAELAQIVPVEVF